MGEVVQGDGHRPVQRAAVDAVLSLVLLAVPWLWAALVGVVAPRPDLSAPPDLDFVVVVFASLPYVAVMLFLSAAAATAYALARRRRPPTRSFVVVALAVGPPAVGVVLLVRLLVEGLSH